MPVSIDGLRLFGAQESRQDSTANTSVTSAPREGPTESLVVALERQERPALSGTVTAPRLVQSSDYPNTPLPALAGWVQEFESLASAVQGTGYTLQDDERGRSINVVVGRTSWRRASGAAFEVQYDIEARRGEGVLDPGTRTVESGTPTSPATLDGTDLGSILEKQSDREVDLSTTPQAFGTPSDAIITPGSGVVRRIDISGRVGGQGRDLQTFSETLRGYLGGNQQLTYQTAFPGVSRQVVVDDYSDTFAAGQPETLRYDLTLLEGVQL